MKILFLVSAILFLQIMVKSQTPKFQTAKSQPLPEWFRVYTSDDGIIELNTNYVMFSSRKIERVRFRWTFQTPQTLRGNPGVTYQNMSEEIQFDCKNENFRFYAIQWFDASGKSVASEKREESDEWRKVGFGSMMEKLFIPACKLVNLRKREPAVE